MFYESIMADAMVYTTALLLVSAGIYALTYMVSKFLNNDKLRKWTESEIYESFATAMFLFGAVAILTMFTNFSDVFMMELIKLEGLEDLYKTLTERSVMKTNELTLQDKLNTERPIIYEDTKEEGEKLLSSDSHMKYSRVFLLNQLNKLDSFYTYALRFNYIFGVKIGKSFPSSPEASTPTKSNSFNEFKDMLFGYLYYGFFFTYIQLALLDLIKMFFIVMFPAGIFLRAFPLTNSLGSSLIAISVGIYFVYPTVLGILLITNHETLQIQENEIILMSINEEPSEFLEHFIKMKMNYYSLSDEESDEKQDIQGDFSNISDLIQNFVQRILLNMFLFPLIALTATYSFIHAFAGFMQANVSELGRGLIRLV